MPGAILRVLEAAPPRLRQTAQELRVRRKAPLSVSTASGGESLPYVVSAAELQEIFYRLCERAVHTHQAELAQGFITTPCGLRVGVAGTAVVKDGAVVSYRDITSLCIRLPREFFGCAFPLLSYVDTANGVKSLLLCGAPATGKTTVLKDLARLLSAHRRVCVVDERSELSAGDLSYCDVLVGCPKARGILQAIRTLSPDAVIADELGDDAEWDAVAQGLFCGVPVIASAHLSTLSELKKRPSIDRLMRLRAFDYVVFLPERMSFSAPAQIWRIEELYEMDGDRADYVCLRGSGNSSRVAVAAL